MNKIKELLDQCIFVDVESTSINHTEAKIIQIGIAMTNEDQQIEAVSDYVDPGMPIPPEVSAITHISDKMIRQHGITHAAMVETYADSVAAAKYRVAHNAFYDKSVMSRELGLSADLEWICTMRLARYAFANNAAVKNLQQNYLRYYLDLEISDELFAHRADHDALCCSYLLAKLVQILIEKGEVDPTIDIGPQLIEIMSKPILITVMPFGKHKGKKMVDIPLDYWKWALDNFDSLKEGHPDYDADLAESVADAIWRIMDVS